MVEGHSWRRNSVYEGNSEQHKPCQDACTAFLKEILDKSSRSRIRELFEDSHNYLRYKNRSLSAFWESCLDMAEILLGLFRALREGDWMIHLMCICVMIPDHLPSSYIPYCSAQMTTVLLEHPDIHGYFMQDGFSVQLGSSNLFGEIPIAQTTEETANKDT